MFFIQTIRDFINDKRESREARRLSADSMNRYFDAGEHVHDSLIAAEEIMGSRELGLGEDDVKIEEDGALTIKYKVDDDLTTVIRRSFSPKAQKEFKRKSSMVYTLNFLIGGVLIKYSPDVYQKLAERTITSIYDRVKDYSGRADANLANYMAKHFADEDGEFKEKDD